MISEKWCHQTYAGPFSDFGITVFKNTRRRYPNIDNAPTYTGTFFYGIDIKQPVNESSMFDDEKSEKSSVFTQMIPSVAAQGFDTKDDNLFKLPIIQTDLMSKENSDEELNDF
jgi:hypothetical protein